jgi:small redox-active disulfide protein 2
MNIKILGSDCPNCQKIESNTKKALEELKMETTVEKITDIQKIMEYNVMSMPVLIVDEKVVIAGSVPDVDQIKEILANYKMSANNQAGACSCNCKC